MGHAGQLAAAKNSFYEAAPRTGIWVSYESGGGAGTARSGEVSTGGMRPPIFSLRIHPASNAGHAEADLLTPGGFDRPAVEAGRDAPGDPYSNAQQREAELVRALMYHRPAMHLRLGWAGPPALRSPESRRFDGCARRLLRDVIEDQLATSANGAQRRLQRERLREDPARTLAPPIESASLLLRLAGLPLPSGSGSPPARPARGLAGMDGVSMQRSWRADQIRRHGRNVRLRLDLLPETVGPAAGMCRSLAYQTISAPRKDSCTIEGVIDRRDRWPITLTVSREGEAVDGTTETQFRNFNRVTPLQTFTSPENPCPSG